MFELVEPNKSSELNLAVSSSCRPPDGWTGHPDQDLFPSRARPNIKIDGLGRGISRLLSIFMRG